VSELLERIVREVTTLRSQVGKLETQEVVVRSLANTWTALQTFQSGIRLPNAVWLVGRNAADTGDVNLIRLNASNRIELGAPLANGSQNLLTNPGFEVWQRGTGPYTTTGAYGPDRWQLAVGNGGTLSVSRDGANQDANSVYCAAVSHTLGTFGSNMQQMLENYQQLRGKTVTFALRVKTATASAVRIQVYDGVGTAWSAYHSGSGAYETLQATLSVASGATQLRVLVAFEATVTVYVDNATLVVGSTPADYVPLHPAEDLGRCQRYYEKSYSVGTAPGAAVQAGAQMFNTGNGTSSQKSIRTYFKVTKAVVPSITVYDRQGNSGKITTVNAAGSALTDNVTPDWAAYEPSDGSFDTNRITTEGGFMFQWVAEANP